MHFVAKGRDSLHATAEPPNGGTKETSMSPPEEEIVAMRANSAGLAPMIAMTVLVLAAVAGFWAIGTGPVFSETEHIEEQHSVGERGRGAPVTSELKTGRSQSVVRR